jgi:hypothetical protein
MNHHNYGTWHSSLWENRAVSLNGKGGVNDTLWNENDRMYNTKYSCKWKPKYLYNQWVERTESLEVYSLAIYSLPSAPSCRRIFVKAFFPSIFHQWPIIIFHYLPLTLYNFSNLLRRLIKQLSQPVPGVPQSRIRDPSVLVPAASTTGVVQWQPLIVKVAAAASTAETR